jgi:hypothetical protein
MYSTDPLIRVHNSIFIIYLNIHELYQHDNYTNSDCISAEDD